MELELAAVIDAMSEALTTTTRSEDRTLARRYLAALATALASAMRDEDVSPHIEELERLFGQTWLLDPTPFRRAFARWEAVKSLAVTARAELTGGESTVGESTGGASTVAASAGTAPDEPEQGVLGGASLIAFLATNQPERAREFYAGTLGLTLVSEDRFTLVFEAGGAPLRVQKVSELLSHAFTSLGWQVADIVAVVSVLAGRGVVFERYPFLQQDELGIWQAPGGASVAWFKDPDGNLLSLTQSSAN